MNLGKDPAKMTLKLEVMDPDKELEQIYQVFNKEIVSRVISLLFKPFFRLGSLFCF